MGNKQGTVIKIISVKEIIVDLGKDDGILIGDRLEIYSIGPEVRNSSGDLIGTLDNIKANLEVITVYQNMSICADVRYTETSITSSIASIASIGLTSYKRQDKINLAVKEEQIDHDLKDELYEMSKNNKINIGDLVRLDS